MIRRPDRLLSALVLTITVAVPVRAQEHPMMSMGAADARKPLPLTAMMADHQKQNMRDHLAAIQAIVAGVGREDMDAVATAAGRIGSSGTMEQMCGHLGAAEPGFTPLALDFHRTADTIAEAARRGNRASVLAALDRTLQKCVACHATYRQEIVDQETWDRLSAERGRH